MYCSTFFIWRYDFDVWQIFYGRIVAGLFRMHLEMQLRELLKLKERQYEQATHIEDTQRLVTEIEMLKVVLHLVSRDN